MRGKLEGLLPDHRLITLDHTEDPELVLADVSRIDPQEVAAVDADHHLARAEAAGLDRLDRQLAGFGLGLGRHRVLQVEDHHVARQGLGLLDGAGVGSRHIEGATAGTVGGHRDCPSWACGGCVRLAISPS